MKTLTAGDMVREVQYQRDGSLSQGGQKKALKALYPYSNLEVPATINISLGPLD